MRAASDEFMTREEGATLGAALTAASHSCVDRRMWYVGPEVPQLDSVLAYAANMWDPGNRVSMVKVAFSREDAIANAAVDLALETTGDLKRLPQKLFEFDVRLDAVLDISTTAKLAGYGLTMPMIVSFYEIDTVIARLPPANAALKEKLKSFSASASTFRKAAKNGTLIEKVTALACAVTFDGMLVPSPWHGGKDLLVFYDGWPGRVAFAHDTIVNVTDHGIINVPAAKGA